MHKPEGILENEMHKILWDFEIQRANQIQSRRLILVLIIKKKRTCHLVSKDHKVKEKGDKKLEKYLDLASELKKAMELEGDGNTNRSQCPWKSFHEPGKETR